MDSYWASEAEVQQAQALSLAPWASRGRHDLLEFLPRHCLHRSRAGLVYYHALVRINPEPRQSTAHGDNGG